MKQGVQTKKDVYAQSYRVSYPRKIEILKFYRFSVQMQLMIFQRLAELR